MSGGKQIIVVKRRGGHGGHHGGAWKVAYADFVTALMSLFIVLWLMNTSQKVRQAVAGYFNDPRGKSTQTGTDQSGSGESLALTENNIADLKKKIEEAIHRMNDLRALQNQIQITITPEGLRIELLETKDGTFFNSGSAELNQNGRELLEMLSGQLGGLPNRISIEGHTDAAPYATKDGYGNWELSTDRANAARRLMQVSGLRPDQVSQVRGYADQKLRVPSNPLDPSNRRISLIVQYLTADAPPVPGSGLPNRGVESAKPEGEEPGVDITAPKKEPAGGAGQKSATPASGEANGKNGTTASGPGGAQPSPPGAARPGSPQPGSPQTAPARSGPAGKPAAAKPAAGKPAAGNIVARLWQKIHSK
jgi:chemotaxis protein MotB